MSVEEPLICPDCGGALNAAAGTRRCTCFDHEKTVATVADLLPEEPGTSSGLAEATGEIQKICRTCGKNLKGHRRYKTELGYQCLACADGEDASASAAGKVNCMECHRLIKAEALVDFGGRLICKVCQQVHIEARERSKLRVDKLGELTLHKEYEKKTLITWACILGGLVVIILLAWFGIL